MNYEKLTLDRFATNLKDGKYESATGARRAIGKTSSWKQTEKEQAQAMVNKHFKVDASVSTKPASQKTSAKKSVPDSKKMAKTAKKAAQKAAQKTAPVEEAPEETETKPAPVKRTPAIEKLAKAPHVAASTTVGATDAVVMSHSLLDIASRAREEISKARSVDPSADFGGIEKELRLVLHRGLALVNVSTEADAGSSTLPSPRVALPAPAPKQAVKVATTVPQPNLAPPVIEKIEAKPEPIANGTGHELTEEEQRVADALRNTTPSMGIAGLPRPVIPSQG